MGKPIIIQYKGKVFGSLVKASQELGCSPVYLRNALEKANGNQKKFEEIISNYKGAKMPVNIDGYGFESLSETERATGISARLLKRIKLECKTDEEFTKRVLEEAEGFYALGEWYWSIREASDKLGVDEQEMHQIFDRYSYSQREMDKQLSNLLEKH